MNPENQKPETIVRIAPDERLLSLDALRGFDMFWIVGAHGIVNALEKLNDNRVVKTISTQLQHKAWEGFAFYDLIFPLFVFMAGVSMAFSLSKSLEQKGLWPTVGKLAFRAALLFIIGIFYSGGFSNKWPNIRVLGVLQRIALSYFFAGLTFCFFNLRGRIAVFAALLIGYWALMSFIPIPAEEGVVPKHGTVAGRFDENTNLSNYVDRHVLSGMRYDGRTKEKPLGDHDPEGMLSTLPAIATCLLGVFAGMLLKSGAQPPGRKAALLLAGGLLCVGAGYLWGLQFPIIKKIWTSSYVLVAGGWSLILLSLFYGIIDVLKLRMWSMPFVWIGANALAIYLSTQFIKYGDAAGRLVGGDIAARLGVYAALVHALATIGVLMLLANFLYRRKVFIRI